LREREKSVQNACSYCGGNLRVTKLTCDDCGLAFEGEFTTPRLARLEIEEQRFVELFVLASGSLKEMARLLGVSYPTVRSRLDRLIENLQKQQVLDDQRKQKILQDMEVDRIPAKQGMRLLENL